MSGDITVLLSGGTYQVSSPLTFTAQDSGRNGHRITWAARGGERPVLSGGTPVTGWTQSATTPGLWSATVPAGTRTRQLYANGQRLPRTSGAIPATLTQTSTGFTASNASMASWRNQSSIEFVFDNGNGVWSQPRCLVSGISGTTVTMQQPCFDNLHLPSGPPSPEGANPAGGFPGLGNGVPTSVENVYELLSPGRWYLDTAARTVYYQARSGENPAAMSFVAATATSLITSSTPAEAPLKDVTFQGLTFSYATWLQPSTADGFAEMQANQTLTGAGANTTQGMCQYLPGGTCPFASWTRQPAAVDLVGTAGVRFIGNTFEHLGGAGLALWHGARNDVVQGNDVHDVSGLGIVLGSTDDPLPKYRPINLAAGRTATQSSTDYNGPAGLATDGNTDGVYRDGSVTHTALQASPWWQVDLGSSGHVWSVDLFNRSELGERLSDYWVFASDKPFDTSLSPAQQAGVAGVWSSHQTSQAGRPTSIPADVTARYVMVQLAGTGYLSLAEVQVLSGAGIVQDNTITDNHVWQTGAEYTGAPAVWLGYTRRSTVVHNQIDQVPYDGISLGWGGWHTDAVYTDANPSIMRDNVISDNLLFNLHLKRADGGAIYSNGALGTELGHGLLLQGNVAFANATLARTYYQDEGGSNTIIDGNTQFLDTGYYPYGYFNGGCSSITHIILKNNYYSSPLNNYECANAGTDVRDGGGNVKIPVNPKPGDIPNSLLAGAGLTSAWTSLTTSAAPLVAAVGPLGSGQVLVSGSGFTPQSTVTVDGVGAASVSYVSSNFLIITTTEPAGMVRVTNAAGTSTDRPGAFGWNPAADLAAGRPASQSSTAYNGPAGLAVDGGTDGFVERGSVTHTGLDTNAWWQVDLGATKPVGIVGVWNRTDYAGRLSDYWVFVSSSPFNTSLTPAQQAAQPGVWSRHETTQADRPSVLFPGTQGRYVMVQQSGAQYLSLAEVQVFS